MYILVLFLIIGIYLLCLVIAKKSTFKPTKYEKIYDIWWCHRGFTACYPENSLLSFRDIVKASIDTDKELGIEVDVRFLKDGNIICFHDRFTKRLLDIPGSIYNFKYTELKKLGICHFNELLSIRGDVRLLIDVKGHLSKRFLNSIENLLYKDFYFHTDSILKYIRLRKTFGKDKVFAKFNIFAMRFNFTKFDRKYIRKCNSISNIIEDISSVLAFNIQNAKSINEFGLSIVKFINESTSRIKPNHYLNTSLLSHRGIASSIFPENSIEGIIFSIEQAINEKIRITLEIDVINSDGKIKCYHNDKPSSRLGQECSCASKLPRGEAIELEEILKTITEKYTPKQRKNVYFVFDLKSYNPKARVFEEKFCSIIKKFDIKYCIQSVNPLCIKWFKENEPKIIRGQLLNSVDQLKKVLPNNLAFKCSCSITKFLSINICFDYVAINIGETSKDILKQAKLLGIPVYGYAPQSFKEINETDFNNFFIEDWCNERRWPYKFIDRFKEES